MLIFTVNNPPRIQGPATFRVNTGQVAEYIFNVTDGDNFTVRLSSTPSGNLTNLIPPAEGEISYKFLWGLQEVTNDFVVFIATDSFNASSQLIPRVEICACENGECTLEGIINLDQNPVILNCLCPDGELL